MFTGSNVHWFGPLLLGGQFGQMFPGQQSGLGQSTFGGFNSMGQTGGSGGFGGMGDMLSMSNFAPQASGVQQQQQQPASAPAAASEYVSISETFHSIEPNNFFCLDRAAVHMVVHMVVHTVVAVVMLLPVVNVEPRLIDASTSLTPIFQHSLVTAQSYLKPHFHYRTSLVIKPNKKRMIYWTDWYPH